jgi:hypothetical protein
MVTDNEVCAELAVDIATPSLRRKELSGPADREAKTNRKVPIATVAKHVASSGRKTPYDAYRKKPCLSQEGRLDAS